MDASSADTDRQAKALVAMILVSIVVALGFLAAVVVNNLRPPTSSPTEISVQGEAPGAPPGARDLP